jgi:hypothetical protein
MRGQRIAQGGGVHQNAGCFGLAHHFGHFHGPGQQAHGGEVLHFQRRAVRAAHGRQLGRVADEQQLVAGVGEDVLEEVGQEVAVEGAPAAGTDHAGFVHHEERVVVAVRRHGDACVTTVVVTPGAVDAAMDGTGPGTREGTEHFRSAAGGRQQHHGPALRREHLHQRTYERGLSRSGVAFQDQGSLGLICFQQACEGVGGAALAFSGVVAEGGEQLLG